MTRLPYAILVLKPTDKFLDWVNRFAKKRVTYEQLRRDPTAYVIDAFESEQAAIEYLWDYCKVPFAHELSKWGVKKSKWPEDLGWDTFMEWFDMEFSQEVLDVREDAERVSGDWVKEL
jgi:hypothetical protein